MSARDMVLHEPLATYLELRQSTAEGDAGAGLSHKAEGLFLLHVLELASDGEPRGAATIVHDAGDHGGRYLEAARVLAQARLAVALPDLRGHGKSEGERGHGAGAREVVRDLAAVQDHVAYRLPTAPKVLIGSGLGALYALHYTLARPDDIAALVLLAPRWRPRFALPRPAGGLLKLFTKPAPSAPGRIGNEPASLLGDADARRAWSADPLVHDWISLRAGGEALRIAADCERDIGSVAVPTLLLHGAADAVADAAFSRAASGPALEVRILDGFAHDLLHERGGRAIAEQVRDWLAQHVA